ncbi:hypothetical protein RJ640_013070, partial [Escallonia rubra]
QINFKLLHQSSMASSTTKRQDCLYLARLSEQAERYDEMVTAVNGLVAAACPDGELTVEERNLLSVAYKNAVGSRRAAWRIVSSVEQKEEGRRSDGGRAALSKGYRTRIEAELSGVCAGILRLLDERLVPATASSESKVFYLKMKGDYCRYLAEFKAGTERKEAAEDTMIAYKAAQDIAAKNLSPTHPIRLGVALNFSVFYYEILNSPEKACQMAKEEQTFTCMINFKTQKMVKLAKLFQLKSELDESHLLDLQ